MPIPVQATFVVREALAEVEDDLRPRVSFDDDDDEEIAADDGSIAATRDDDEEDEETDARESYADDAAPWSPVPLRPSRDWAKRDATASIDIVFPTVYEEDRSAKLKDLITAQAAGIITHQRMSEQAAKELGFETYVYSEELKQILDEMKKLPANLLGAADAIAGASPKGGGGGGTFDPGAPGGGGGFSNSPERRGDVSTDAKSKFRQQQRSMVSTEDETDHLSEASSLQMLVSALREVAVLRSKPDENALAERAALREALAATRAIMSSLTALMEASAKQPVPQPPAAGDVNVTSPTVEVAAPQVTVNVPEQPAPIVNVTVQQGGKVIRDIVRDAHGRATQVIETPEPSGE